MDSHLQALHNKSLDFIEHQHREVDVHCSPEEPLLNWKWRCMKGTRNASKRVEVELG